MSLVVDNYVEAEVNPAETRMKFEGREFSLVPIMDDLKGLAPNPGIILDCGAGLGFFAEKSLAKFPAAEIFSFEPVEALHARLEAIGQKNERYHLIRAAVGDEEVDGKTIYLTAGRESNSFLPFLPGNPLPDALDVVCESKVSVLRIDDFCRRSIGGVEKVGILKLDVQGYELHALRGATELLKRFPVVMAEVAFQHQYDGDPLLEDVDAFMVARGYRRYGLYPSVRPDVWGDALYVKAGIRLDIGSGDHPLAGYTPIDRIYGQEAFPLTDYADGSVDEIHASHILEHFSFGDVEKALSEWVRVLKPGGVIRVAVPDMEKVMANPTLANDAIWRFHAMGGQTSPDDFHRSCFTAPLLRHYMEQAGVVEIEPWQSLNGNCASLPISLNLMGRKGTEAEIAAEKAASKEEIKIVAIMSVPRVGWNDAWGSVFDALFKLKIPLFHHKGVYWGQCMQRAFEAAIADGIDWIVTIDYDTMFTPQQLDQLIGTLAARPDIDAIAALQCRRAGNTPLCTVGDGQTEKLVDGAPFKVATAHFGLTILRTDAIKALPKPWFWSKPDEKGEWGPGRMDDDIWFWHQWKEAGKTVYVHPEVAVGHLEVVVSGFENRLEQTQLEPSKWLERYKGQKHWRT